MRSKSALVNTTLLAAAVQRAQAGDLNAAIVWDPESQVIQRFVPVQIYGLANMGIRLEHPVTRIFSGSLEERLERILEASSDLPSEIIKLTPLPDDERIRRIFLPFEELISLGPVPQIDSQIQQFLDDFPGLDIRIAMYPLLRNSRLFELIWASEVQHRYWPLTLPTRYQKGGWYETFHREITTELIEMCGT